MKFVSNLTQNAGRTASKLALRVKANAPSIAIIGGLVLVGTGVGIGTYRSVKFAPKIDEYSQRAEYVKTSVYDSEKERKHDLGKVRRGFALELAKIYGLPLTMVIIGSGGVLYGHHLFKVRNFALAGSNAIFQNQVDRLSNELDDKFGPGTADRVRNGGTVEKRDVTEVDDDGKEKTSKKKVNVFEKDDIGDFCMFFDERSGLWHKSSALNLSAIKNAEKLLTLRLKNKGYLFLDEAYEELMIPIIDSKMKCIFHSVGWVYDENAEDPEANAVSFRVFDNVGGAKVNYVNGYEDVILLDPNVQGDVYSKMLDDSKIGYGLFDKFKKGAK